AYLMRVIPAMPQVAGPKLTGLPAQVALLGLCDLEDAVAEELGVPLRQAELPGHAGTAKVPDILVPAAIHRPIPRARHAKLAGEDWLHALRGPVLEPIGQLLARHEVEVEVDRVHRAEIAGGMVIDD